MADADAATADLILAGRPDPLRRTGDLEIEVPFHALEQAPWNPKKPIHGVYRRGLAGSLAQWSMRDRLKVWPHPRDRGRYVALDGNQRLDVLREMIEDHLIDKKVVREVATALTDEGVAWREAHPGEEPPPGDESALFKRVEAARKAFRADESLMGPLRLEAMGMMVPVRVLADLDADEAKLFTAAYDRNHAAYDEDKLARLVDDAQANRERLGILTDAARKRLDAITRPIRAIVPPPPPPDTRAPDLGPAGGTESPAPAPPPPAPTADEPWGPPPPPPPAETRVFPDGPRPRPAPLVPVIIPLTAEAHAELEDGLLRCKARPVRSARLVEAFERFGRAAAQAGEDADFAPAFVETLLLSLQRRAAIFEAPTE